MPRQPFDAPIAFDPAAAEVRGLCLGLRSAWRLRLRLFELEAFRQAARAHGLHMAVSDQAWTAQTGGQLAPRPLPTGQVALLAVLARDQADAQQCLDWETELHHLDGRRDGGDAVARMVAVHHKIGRAYGYPPCCIEAFCDAFVEVVTTERTADNPVAVARAAWRTQRFHPLLDTLTVDLGEKNATPLRHLPCRFDCPRSLALAGRLLANTKARPLRPRTVVVLTTGEVLAVATLARRVADNCWQLDASRFVRVLGHTPLAATLRQHADKQQFGNAVVVPGLGLHLFPDGQQKQLVSVPKGVAANLLPVLLPFGADSAGGQLDASLL